jgi:hypothetical protein
MKTEKLYRYMSARAAHEGVPHTLEPSFYEEAFKGGVRRFFNVEIDRKGNLLSDRENPGFMASWRKAGGI